MRCEPPSNPFESPKKNEKSKKYEPQGFVFLAVGGSWGIRTPVPFGQTVFKSLKAFGIPYSAMLWNGIFFQKNERWTAYLLDFICFSLLYVFLQCFTLFFVFCVFWTAFCRVFVEKRQTFTKAIILFQNKNVNK